MGDLRPQYRFGVRRSRSFPRGHRRCGTCSCSRTRSATTSARPHALLQPPVDRCYTVEPVLQRPRRAARDDRATATCSAASERRPPLRRPVSNQITSTLATVSCWTSWPGGTCGNAISRPGAVRRRRRHPATAARRCAAGSGNAFTDPGEECDDGNLATGDGCSPTCTHEPLCGDSSVDAGEQCDDGNLSSGDGCSAACQTEPCLVLRSGQSVWAKARVSVKKPGTDRSGLSISGTFGLGLPVASLGLGTTGARLILENRPARGASTSRCPPAVCGASAPASGSIAIRPAPPAIRKVVVRDRTRGGSRTCRSPSRGRAPTRSRPRTCRSP